MIAISGEQERLYQNCLDDPTISRVDVDGHPPQNLSVILFDLQTIKIQTLPIVRPAMLKTNTNLRPARSAIWPKGMATQNTSERQLKSRGPGERVLPGSAFDAKLQPRTMASSL